MESKAPVLVPSGIEPVDRLLGGLENGLLYLVHGETSGKSLFGIKFLLEGIKQGRSAALIIRYSPEDAVRRFARLGYDCLEDVQSGRLIILEFADDIVQQVTRLRELSPMLRELGDLLSENRPQRLVFDPITDLVLSTFGNIESRAKEFAAWAESLGSTCLLIANGGNRQVTQSFWPFVKESFRFEFKEQGERTLRSIAFEKSPHIPSQVIEVDPSRGIFLVGKVQSHDEPQASAAPAAGSGGGWLEIAADLLARSESQAEPKTDDKATGQVDMPEVSQDHTGDLPEGSTYGEVKALAKAIQAKKAERSAIREGELKNTGGQSSESVREKVDGAGEVGSVGPTAQDEEHPKELNDWLDELIAWAIESPDQPRPERKKPAASANAVRPAGRTARDSGARAFSSAAPPDTSAEEQPHDRPSPHLLSRRGIDSFNAARAVEELLRPPDLTAQVAEPEPRGPRQEALPHDFTTTVGPKEFNVLVIDGDPSSTELVVRSVGEYNVQTAGDGMSGLAKLLSFRPDLVILDLDLPLIDGFKLLSHIRASLNMPIIVVSGLYVRSSDRIKSSELGADYYLTKPFSVKELRQKARQLIARYRGITEWITKAPGEWGGRMPGGGTWGEAGGFESSYESRRANDAPPLPGPFGDSHSDLRHNLSGSIAAAGGGQTSWASHGDRSRGVKPSGDLFIAYSEFVSRVEDSVKAGMDSGSSFSIVGCRMPHSLNGTVTAVRFFGLVLSIVRSGDLISMNQRSDFVVLLPDADAAGAKAFIGRLLDRVRRDMNQEPLVWLRSFPHLEEATEVGRPTHPSIRGTANPYSNIGNDRRTERSVQTGEPAAGSGVPAELARPKQSEKPDPRESYIDLLKNL